MLKSYIYIILLVGWAQAIFGQNNDNCNSATVLCANNIIHANNYNATTQVCTGCADGNLSVGVFCYEVNNTIWFSFTTNTVGGNATIDFSNLSCLVGAGMDNELEASVFTASTVCDPTTYAILQCTSTPFSSSQSLNLVGLTPSTTYYIHVDGDDVGSGISAAAQCEFDIEISGPAVEPDITSSVTNATCAGSDGEIEITAISGSVPVLTYSINGGAFQSSSTFTGLDQGTYSVVIASSAGCSYAEEITVGLTGGPQDGLPSIVSASCSVSDGEISITGVTGGTGPYSYSLNGGANQPSNTFSGLNAGQYAVTVTDAAGCSFTYENINLSVAGSISSATFDIIQPTCETATGTLTVTPVGGAAPYTYSLNGGIPTSSNVFSGLAPGTYLILIIDDNGCIFSNNQIVVNPATQTDVAQINLSPSSVSICQGTNVTFNASYTNGGTTPLLQWQLNGANVGAGGATFSSSTLNNGDVITCTLISNDPCVISTTVTSASVTATVIPQVNPTITISSSETSVCAGETITYSSVVSDCGTDGTYYWFVNGVVRDSTSGPNLTLTMTSNAEVICTFMCNDPCSNPATSNSLDITVTTVLADAGPNQQIGEGESTSLEGQGTGTVEWSPGSSLSSTTVLDPVASPEGTTTYTLTVTNNGCVATDEVTIVVTELIIVPNTFTPNEDGTNDVWHIGRIENFPACKVTVYDRWGQKVYNSTGYSNDNPWDGTYLGKPLPAAAYYYVIELNAASSKEADTYYGWISIIY